MRDFNLSERFDIAGAGSGKAFEGMKTIVTTLGFHRSGTSMLTGIIGKLGVDLGINLMAADNGNEKGYFENNDIVRTNDLFLDAIGERWDSYTDFPPDLQRRPEATAAIAGYAAIFATQYAGDSQVVGFKDPRIGRLLPLWREFVKKSGAQEKFIVAVRNPFGCAKSLERRDGFPHEKTYLIWWRTYLDIQRSLSERGAECLFLDYDDMLARPGEQVDRIVRFLSLEPNSAMRADAMGFVRGELNHSEKGQAPACLHDAYLKLKDGAFDGIGSVEMRNLMGEFACTQAWRMERLAESHKGRAALQHLEAAALSAASGRAGSPGDSGISPVFGGGVPVNLESVGHLLREITERRQADQREINRLRTLLYSASAGSHFYRGWRVLTGDPHYCVAPVKFDSSGSLA